MDSPHRHPARRAAAGSAPARQHRERVHEKQLVTGAVLESPRRLPIRADVDVLVCGGGPAGVGAALAAAAREGAKTLLVERWGVLGGVWTAAGLAAAWAAAENMAPDGVSGPTLREAVTQRGAQLLDAADDLDVFELDQ